MEATDSSNPLKSYYDNAGEQISSMFRSVFDEICPRYGYHRDQAFGRHPGWRIRRNDISSRMFDIAVDWDTTGPPPPITADAIFVVSSGVVHADSNFQFRLFRPFSGTKMRLGLLEAKIDAILEVVLPMVSSWNSAKVIAEGVPLDLSSWKNVTLDHVCAHEALWKLHGSPLQNKLISDEELELTLEQLRSDSDPRNFRSLSCAQFKEPHTR